MKTEEKTLARILFENKIFRSDGQSFEDLFTEIMSLSEPNFRKIKAWGNIGDRKNDGYIPTQGIYYQVYAPEDIKNKYPEVISKINNDFSGLIKKWNPVNEFYFVINDKFLGVNADSERTIKNLANKYILEVSNFLTADDLIKIVFNLEDDLILKIIGFLPNVENITTIDYSVLNQVISHIMKIPLSQKVEDIKTPDWDDKIKFNKLGQSSKFYLNNGSIFLGSLNNFLSGHSFLAEELQGQMNGIYIDLKEHWNDLDITGDNIFWEIVHICSPMQENSYQSAIITIMSKYFESCDIFEEPV